ncbi:MAG: hypothetical protein KKE20_00785 [Nanoarchaeota archaeon]|nr:hypothetical protein [Nanoarchaeota archaeon]
MAKRCIICGEEAGLCIKGSSESYCDQCAQEHFSDVSLLVKVEEEAQTIRDLIGKRRSDPEEDQ